MWRCGSGSFRGEDRSVFRLDPRMMLQRKEAGFKSDFKVSRWKHHGVWSAELGRRRRNYGGLQRWYLCFHWWHVVFLTSFSCHSLENFTASLTSRCLLLFINLSVPWGELKKNIKKVWFWALFGGKSANFSFKPNFTHRWENMGSALALQHKGQRFNPQWYMLIFSLKGVCMFSWMNVRFLHVLSFWMLRLIVHTKLIIGVNMSVNGCLFIRGDAQRLFLLTPASLRP